ncbi:phage protein, HK97 gp10 family [Gottschalkia purinilytica]|uniref:Phage protein, HK97 gp10 family n=1 Tax=Gottschalkia purinilytica TaxID=1503 RepID=A0A0L0W654_GOTPU|nr:HK97-gp10 family putative phage morphogenesis protein [Gottschalkia purinilytica]KNF07008.1 phage protein, HK97 gp10 family [Gottschalkia purinilytica]
MKLEGMDELLRKLEDMGNVGSRIENQALKKAAEPILQEAKSNVKVRTGKLKEGLKIGSVKSKNGNKYVEIGITKDDTSKIFYGKFLEWGTSKMKARPFLGPAFESKKNEAKNIIKDEVKRGLGL